MKSMRLKVDLDGEENLDKVDRESQAWVGGAEGVGNGYTIALVRMSSIVA